MKRQPFGSQLSIFLFLSFFMIFCLGALYAQEGPKVKFQEEKNECMKCFIGAYFSDYLETKLRNRTGA